MSKDCQCFRFFCIGSYREEEYNFFTTDFLSKASQVILSPAALLFVLPFPMNSCQFSTLSYYCCITVTGLKEKLPPFQPTQSFRLLYPSSMSMYFRYNPLATFFLFLVWFFTTRIANSLAYFYDQVFFNCLCMYCKYVC